MVRMLSLLLAGVGSASAQAGSSIEFSAEDSSASAAIRIDPSSGALGLAASDGKGSGCLDRSNWCGFWAPLKNSACEVEGHCDTDSASPALSVAKLQMVDICQHLLL